MNYSSIIIAFFTNGVLLLIIKYVGARFSSKIFFALITYIFATVIASFFLKQTNMEKIKKVILGSIFLGFLLGINITLLTVSSKYVEGYILFPVVYGGAIIINAFLAPILFKEKINLYMVLGIISGTTGIILLNI
jgi:multidrug transporter EmrE-like cation transporter